MNHLKYIFNLLIISLSIVLLTLPIVGYNIGLNDYYPLKERRSLTKMPELNIAKLGESIDKFEEFFNDNFGGRTVFITLFCYLKYNILGISPYPEEVVIGKDGWLFLGDKKSNIYSKHLGVNLIKPKELNLIKKKVIDIKEWSEDLGIKFYLFIAPDKYSVYPEYLPDNMNTGLVNRNLDNLVSSLKANMEVIDVRNELNLSKEKEKLYAKADSHWNDYGAFIAYKKIIRVLSKDFPTLKALSISDFVIKRKKRFQASTADMINAQKYIDDEGIIFELKKDRGLIKEETRLRKPGYMKNSSKPYEIRYKCLRGTKLKILVFRDSFSNRLIKFLSNNFDESLYINNFHKFDKKLVQEENPDIVLFEIVERDMSEYLRKL